MYVGCSVAYGGREACAHTKAPLFLFLVYCQDERTGLSMLVDHFGISQDGFGKILDDLPDLVKYRDVVRELLPLKWLLLLSTMSLDPQRGCTILHYVIRQFRQEKTTETIVKDVLDRRAENCQEIDQVRALLLLNHARYSLVSSNRN